MREIAASAVMWFTNHVVTNIPIWHLRKGWFRLLGLSIGRGSRILLGTTFQGISHIEIGEHSYINTRCHLDGRGGIRIGNNVNISNFSIVITGSHSKSSDEFSYRTGFVNIDDFCWLGTHAIVLDKTHLRVKVVVGAGSVIKGDTEENSVYVGVPAKKVSNRGLVDGYDISWRPWFS